jgi:hypothetical protein
MAQGVMGGGGGGGGGLSLLAGREGRRLSGGMVMVEEKEEEEEPLCLSSSVLGTLQESAAAGEEEEEFICQNVLSEEAGDEDNGEKKEEEEEKQEEEEDEEKEEEEDVNEEEQEEQEEERAREIPRSRVSAAHQADAHGDRRDVGPTGGEGLGSGLGGCGAGEDVAKAAATLAALHRRPLPLPWLFLSDLPTHPLAAATAAAAADGGAGGFIQRQSSGGGDGSGGAVTPHKVRRWLRAAREEAQRDGGGNCGEPGVGQEAARGKQGLAPQGAKEGREQDGKDVDGGVWEEAAAAGGGGGREAVLPSCAVAANFKAILDVLREGGGGRGEDCGLFVRLAFICQALPPSRPGGGGRCGDSCA